MIVPLRILFLHVISLVFLLSCASFPKSFPTIDAAPDKLSSIKTITIIKPPEIDYIVDNKGVSMVSPLLSVADLISKSNRLTHALNDRGFKLNANFANSVATKLTALGYEAIVADGPWEKTKDGFTIQYEKINSPSDSILLIFPKMAGFISVTMLSDYFPIISVEFILLGKDRKEMLYRGLHCNGKNYCFEDLGWKISSISTSFANFDALLSDLPATESALNDAANAIAETLSADLKK